MKKECIECGSKIGLLTLNCQLSDGNRVCHTCIESIGFTTKEVSNAEVIKGFLGVDSDFVKEAIAGAYEPRKFLLDLSPIREKEEQKQMKGLDKESQEIQQFMDKYNLHALGSEDLTTLKRIANDLAGNGFFKVGMAFSLAKAEEQAKVTYLSALVEQNWMIINQLGKLNNNIERLIDEKR